ncbi:glycoside hydrolase family 108 protein [Oceanidesulfovibrio marinus]|uniref:Uncharacterized protein n=1 Tax=Oceanidesulfovibrio marinus TaxID=370038 RepID=A0A6P1ZJ96_9BACT|nr:glycosyl hydrolase 108 family protein [Oceanidesulfovibrio marinus]TVM35616.1 hypothetical protein DQK91_02830 [Oceanidesulfovibrio marinus]
MPQPSTSTAGTARAQQGRSPATGSGCAGLEDHLFECAFAFTQKWEGGARFHVVEGDPGGATKYGVSLRFLKGLPLRLADRTADGVITWHDVQALDAVTAKAIFHRYFWDATRCGSMTARVAVTMFDSAVNLGRRRAVRFLQLALGDAYTGRVDGLVGPKTLGAIRNFNDLWLACVVLDLREDYYCRLAESREWARKFIGGWINRTTDLKQFIQEV